MINHVRTVLLNRSRRNELYELWDRYIDPNFNGVKLTPCLAMVRSVLTGNITDWLTLTYRIEAILELLKLTRYSSEVNKFDTRTTEPLQLPFECNYSDTLTPLSEEAHDSDCYLLKFANRPAVPFTIRRSWEISVLSATEVSIQDRVKHASVITGINVENRIPIDEDLGLSMHTIIPGAAWLLTSMRQPLNSIVEVISAVLKLSNDTLQELFVPYDNSQQDQMDTYKRWYYQNTFLEDKVVAVVLAYVLKCGPLLKGVPLL